MIKHDHKEFPSDIFLILETIEAQVILSSAVGQQSSYTPKDFLAENVNKRILLKVILPALNSNTFVLRTYKVN